MATITCPKCGREIDVSNRISGDVVWCPTEGCDTLIMVRFFGTPKPQPQEEG